MITVKDGHLVTTASDEFTIIRLLKHFKLTEDDLERWLVEKSPLFKKKGKKTD